MPYPVPNTERVSYCILVVSSVSLVVANQRDRQVSVVTGVDSDGASSTSRQVQVLPPAVRNIRYASVPRVGGPSNADTSANSPRALAQWRHHAPGQYKLCHSLSRGG